MVEWTTSAGEKRAASEDDETCPLLTGADLSEAKLSNGSINRATLSGAQLTKLDMRGFDLRKVDFSNVSLEYSDLTKANLTYATLDGASLRYVDGQGASFYSSTLRGADLTSARLDGAMLGFADFSGAKLSATSMIGAELNRSIFFGANLSNTRIWGTAPPRLKAFALAAFSELDFSAPHPFVLSTVRDMMKSSTGFPIDDNSYFPRLSVDLLNANVWEKSEELRNWRSLSKLVSRSSDAVRELGVYLADLGCQNNRVLRGILNTHLLSRDYGYYDNYSPVPVRPAGVAEADLTGNEVSSPHIVKPKPRSIRYDDNAELMHAFLDRLTQADCKQQLKYPKHTISQLTAAIDSRAKSEKGEDLQIVMFEHSKTKP